MKKRPKSYENATCDPHGKKKWTHTGIVGHGDNHCYMIFILFFLREQLLIPAISSWLGLMTILVGAWKLGEPHLVSLCQDCLQYHHKYGGWILKWRNIQQELTNHVSIWGGIWWSCPTSV